MKSLKTKKGFTVIELMVTTAIIGVIVLMAAIKLTGHTNEANLAKIQNDVKVFEREIEAKMVEDNSHFDDLKWERISKEDLEQYRDSNSLYSINGLVDKEEEFNDEYVKIEDNIAESNLFKIGQFIFSSGGKVYYQSDEIKVAELEENGSNIEDNSLGNSVNPSNPEEHDNKDSSSNDVAITYPEHDIYLATDEDFQWVALSSNVNSYTAVGETTKGYFKYVGKNKEIIKIPHEIQGTKITSYFQMFINTTTGLKKVVSDNPNITNMSNMFKGNKAAELDVSQLNTENVEKMEEMFSNTVADLDVSNFNTSKLTNTRNMFLQSKSKTLDLSKWNTSNITDMYGMFSNANALTKLDVSNWDTSSVTNMSLMFNNVSLVKELNVSNWNTSNVTLMPSMFSGTTSLVKLDVSNWDTSNVIDIASMFENSSAPIIDVGNWDTSKVTTTKATFFATKSKVIDVSNWDTSNVKNMQSMFQESSVEKLDLNSFNTSKVTNITSMFEKSAVNEIKPPKVWDFYNTTNIASVFESTTNLSTIDLSTIVNFRNSSIPSTMFRYAGATSGYVPEQYINKFNSAPGKPSTLIFIVKP